KYDSAFILNAMSDYEDDPDQDPEKPITYIRRIPDYRSQLVSTLYADIDKITDPSPDKESAMKCRKEGPPVNAEPPVARALKNRIRAWQVKPELLTENPHWIGRRVASNGIAWGDAEDPVEEMQIKRKSDEMGGKPGIAKKRRPNAETRKKVSGAVDKLNTLLGDETVDSVFGE
ncbi:hypothetical protein C8R43DRAFT_900610, partial [Mycena crocata]